jgi:anti-sigma regulatory factor (Ser/Thr protein kinase)
MAMFQSRRDEWRRARAFIDDFCEQAHIGRDVCLRCRLVLEELFLNTVKHGHKGGSDAPIWIALSTGEGEIAVTYEDHAPPFNPFPLDREAIVKRIEEERTEGGLGVILMHDLAAGAQYAYLFGRNRIQLTVQKG